MLKLDWIFYRLIDKLFPTSVVEGRKSYSQCGEDLIVRFIFDSLHIPSPTYLDIGAHHPHLLSNTYLFYAAGSRGVNIEPDPELFDKFRTERPRDINLNIGVSDKKGVLKLFVMSTRTLNTFSVSEAEMLEDGGKFKIEQQIDIPVFPVNFILEEHFKEAAPDFVTIDVEGLDIQILQSLDFSRWRPKVFCVETITYSDRRAGCKIPEIADLLHSQGYFSFADTYVNTIFVDRSIWQAT